MNQIAFDTVVGWCDGYERGHVRGWAWYPRQPHQTVMVQLVIGEQIVAEAAACVSRPDLKSAGIGHGRYAFAIPFTLPPHAPQALHVVVRAKDGPVLNGGELDILTSPEEQRLHAHRASRDHLEAVFGSLTSDTLTSPACFPVRPPMNFVLHCTAGTADVATKLGTADYSYLFVMRGFRAALRRLGTVHVVADPARQVDAIFAACRNRHEECFYLSFAPPHATMLDLACPTIPVIAWEFGTVPTQVWDDEPRHDWRRVLRQCGRAIAISGYAADVIARTMGPKFSVSGIPTPVWDRLSGLRARLAVGPCTRAPIALDGFIWDSRTAPFWLGMTLPPIPQRPTRQPVAPSLRDWRFSLAEAAAATQATAQAAAARLADEEAAGRAQDRAAAAEAASRALIHAEQMRREEADRPKTLRHHAGRTGRRALTWYRDVARDVLPPVLAKGMSVAGRLAWQTGAAVRPSAPPAMVAPPTPVAAPKPEPAPPSPEPAPPSPEPAPPSPAPAPRWHPAPEEPPLPEPALAVFDPDPYPQAEPTVPEERAVLTLDGVVFTAVLAPKDGRKNWQDILIAFVFAFRTTPDATLVFKMIGTNAAFWWWEFHDIVTRLPGFACRVVVLQGYLDDEMYQRLIGNTQFVTNASLAEGQCLPLVEFMSAGRPAVAPRHTAMTDYITPENAVIVDGDVEYCAWPHDPRNELVATRYRMNWCSLRDAFVRAHRIATTEPDRYDAMGEAAKASMQRYCSDDTVVAALEAMFCLRAPAAAPSGDMAA